MKWLFNNMRYKLLAVFVALLLWGVSHSTESRERGFDVPVAVVGVPDTLVVTEQSHGAVNIRVRGSRAALRSLGVGELEYEVSLAGSKAGSTQIEVDVTALERQLPRGAEIVSRSPLSLEFALERRATRSVRIRPDLEGDPATGFVVGTIAVEPPRVRITGARSEVLRLAEVLTETIDVTGAAEPIERVVKASLRGRNVWVDQEGDITVRVDVKPVAGDEGTG